MEPAKGIATGAEGNYRNGYIGARSGDIEGAVEAFENFDEEQVVNIISNTVNNSDHATGNSLFNYYPTFNPIDKMVELYERMLQQQREMIQKLERLIEKK